MAESESDIRIPEKRWYQISDLFTRIDEMLAEGLKADKQVIELLKVIAGIGIPPVPIEVRPIVDGLKAVVKALDRNFPNFIDLKEFTTATSTSFKELTIHGIGFVINDVGGGFSFKVDKQGAATLTAVAGDKYDFEFKDILVKGAGAGTGKIIYWRRG